MEPTNPSSCLDAQHPLIVPRPSIVVNPCVYFWCIWLQPDSQNTFGPHGQVGWYIGPSLEYYRCYKVYFPDKFYDCDVLRVDFFTQQIPFSATTKNDYLLQTAEDMLHLLNDARPSPHLNPLSFGAPVFNAFCEVTKSLVVLSTILWLSFPTIVSPPLPQHRGWHHKPLYHRPCCLPIQISWHNICTPPHKRRLHLSQHTRLHLRGCLTHSTVLTHMESLSVRTTSHSITRQFCHTFIPPSALTTLFIT